MHTWSRKYTDEEIKARVRELIKQGYAVEAIARATGADAETIRAMGNLREYTIPPEFETPTNAPRKTLRDKPDTYWDVNAIEDYNETPVENRMNLGMVPVFHSLKMADPFHCPHCGVVTMFTYIDTSIPHVYTMRCNGTWNGAKGCGYEWVQDCR